MDLTTLRDCMRASGPGRWPMGELKSSSAFTRSCPTNNHDPWAQWISLRFPSSLTTTARLGTLKYRSMLSRVCVNRLVPGTRAASTRSVRGLQAILEKHPEDVVITFAQRTAMGRAKKGQLKDFHVDEILRSLFKVRGSARRLLHDILYSAQATLAKTGLDPSKIDDICVGTCHPPSPLYASRAAALSAGIPDRVPISTVNRLCSSGLMAIRNVAHAIQTGETSLGVAVGVESMSLKYVSRFHVPRIMNSCSTICSML